MNNSCAPKKILNAFSVDVEGFVESNVQSFPVPDRYIDKAGENREIEQNMDFLLGMLDTIQVRGTFFFVGRIADDLPQVIRKTAQAGHEIGCHNFEHLRVFGLQPAEFKEKIVAAKKKIEDVSGQRVYGFRAPDFSITQQSIWALDILKDAGFIYDTSIYPFGMHDVYGIPTAKPTIHYLDNGLVEFPMSTVEIFGKRIPFCGGGYFRLYPLWLTKRFLSKTNEKGIPQVFYIHPYEVGPVIPKIKEMSAYRKFRHYYGCGGGGKKVQKLLEAFPFAPIIEVLKETGHVKNP